MKNRKNLRPLQAFATAALLLPAAGGFAFSLDSAPGRLPKDVVPLDYAVAIKPDAKAMSISGRESVLVEVRRPTATLQFNSLNQVLRDVRLDGKPVAHVTSDDKAQLTTVTLHAPASKGRHTLSFTFEGRIETQPIGLFAQPYKGADGRSGVLLSTQMEATDARRMFPCWDEPAFRATFRLTVTVPAAWQNVSNMPVAKRVVHGELATVSFGKTPRMPSYLIEYTGGDLGEISATNGGTRFGVWAVRGEEKKGAVALANAQKILADYNDYFGVPYPLPKLDSIAVPGGFQGAMENWGAITYNDQTLLLSPSSSIGDVQVVFAIQAHEMAHQWNGDLVTMAWWDDIWLNESFASWMAAKETDLRNPTWKWWEAQDADKERAMAADARAASHPIEQHVTDELQATNAFDPEITYNKGQSILRMFEAYLGPDVFRAGIRGFMKAHAFSNATTADLWQALGGASGQDVGAIVAGWTQQAGFPVVEVAASCDAGGSRTLTLSQHRFLLQGTATGSSHWQVPLQIRVGTGGVPKAVLLTRDGQTIAAGRCDEPVNVDAGALGFYRAHYDPATLALDTRAFGALPDADRIALLDNQWAMVESGIESLPTYLGLASAMGEDLDSRAWTQIGGAIGRIEYAERGRPGHEAFAAFGRKLLGPVLARLGWDERPGETPDVKNLRIALIGGLGNLDDPQVVAEAQRRFQAFRTDRASLPPDQQGAVLGVVAQHADAATFEQLHALARGARDETELRRFYGALTDVRDPAQADQVAKIALSDEIPPQADAVRLRLVLSLAADHQQLAWRVLHENLDRLMKPVATFAPLVTAQYVPTAFWSGIPLDEVESWVRSRVPAEMNDAVARGMETARFRFAERDRLAAAADAYLAR